MKRLLIVIMTVMTCWGVSAQRIGFTPTGGILPKDTVGTGDATLVTHVELNAAIDGVEAGAFTLPDSSLTDSDTTNSLILSTYEATQTYLAIEDTADFGTQLRSDAGDIADAAVAAYTETDGVWAADSANVVHFADTAEGGTIATKTEVAAVTFTLPDSVLTESDTTNSLILSVYEAEQTYAPIASPTFTTSITIGDAGITETELEILDGATVSTTELNYVAGVTSAVQDQIDALQVEIDDTVPAEDYLVQLADLRSIAVFGLGRGLESDTAQFVEGAIGGVFCWGEDSLVVDSLRTCMSSGSGTEACTINVFWGVEFGTADDSLFTAATTINTLTGETDVPNNSTTIPPNVFVWGVIRGLTVGNLPSGMWSTLIGHIKRD